MKSDYDIIKKAYGENFAQLCSSLFQQILENEGVLPDLMMSLFAPSRFLYDDVMANGKEVFQNYVMGKFYEKYPQLLSTKSTIEEVPTPEELFDRAGYVLTKCETDEDVKSFMHYYQPAERLCTFHDPYRIKTNTIFWAVKKNADKIRREDFKNPMRQDEYGTSVISLQFTKGETSVLSIKNRYNHIVTNPDSTFSNDLENIYPGLTKSFEQHYGIHQVENAGGFEMPNYVLANDGRRYRYNYEIDNVYYCPKNIIIRNGEVEYYDSRRYDIVDYFIIDKQEKTFVQAPNMGVQDSFADAHKDIEKIEIEKIKDTDGEKRITITMKGNAKAVVTIDKYNRIIAYSNESLTQCGDAFLYDNNSLTELHLPALTQCGGFFLYDNNSLTELHLPALTQCRTHFLCSNNSLTELHLPALTQCGGDFLRSNNSLTELHLPALTKCSYCFLNNNKSLTELHLPILSQCGIGFLPYNKSLTELNAPNLPKKIYNCLHSIVTKNLNKQNNAE